MTEGRPQGKATPAAGPAPAPAAEAPGSPVKKGGPTAFSRNGFLILAAIVVVEAGVFVAFLGGKGKGSAASAEGALQADPAADREHDFEEFLRVGRAILDVGEIKVPITSTQPRAPRSISATIQVVVSKELGEKLAGGGGGHGGGKANPQRDVLVLNIRSILRGMMDADGIRLIEPSAKGDLERRAKDRLNNVQIDGDEEKTQVLKILRGQVLQVIIDKFDTQTY